MFGGLMTVAAVCVALAISGWQPPDISTYKDYPNAPLISYDQAQLEWYYQLMKNEMAEWFLFVDDQKLIDFDSPDIYTCRCSGTYGDLYRPDEHSLPKLYLQPYQGLTGSGLDLYRLTLLVDRVQAKAIFIHLKNLIRPNDRSAIIIPTEKTRHWPTLTLDGKMLMLSIAIQIAILACKRYIDKKNERFQQRQSLTMADLENYERDILGLSFQPAYHAALSKDEDIDKIKSEFCQDLAEPVEFEEEAMFSWSSQSGFSSNWYKITSLEDTSVPDPECINSADI